MTEPVVLADILRGHAEARGDRPFAHFPGGEIWDYSRMLREAERVRDALAALGVEEGEPVFVWLPNGPDFLRFWFGVNLLGAVFTPCNLAWRGAMLERALSLSEARVAIVHADLAARLQDVPHEAVEHLILVGGEIPDAGSSMRIWDAAHLPERGDVEPCRPDLHEWSNMQLVFTSGTTGASKAVLSSYRQAADFLHPPFAEVFGPETRFLLVLPLFHAGGLASVYAVLRAGASVIVPTGFRTQDFWPLVREHGATSTTLVEQMASFLMAQPERDDDADNSLAYVNIAPMGEMAYRFAERFGAQLWTSYGSTEMGAPIVSWPQPGKPGLTGLLRAGYEARIVDSHDMPVAAGVIGELVVRSDMPWRMLSAYHRQPEATAAAWANGWFHSGDMFRQDSDGCFYFVDRSKDCIRRRGENISSQEVEREIVSHDAVVEAAVFAVPGEASEDEVMACVVVSDDVKWSEIIDYLRLRVPHYMIPRYFRRIDAVPRTENGKIRKDGLKGEGVTADSWDRERFGIVVRAERVGARG